MSIAPTQNVTTIRISPPVSEKVTAKGPLPWLQEGKFSVNTNTNQAPAQTAEAEADTSWGGDGFGFDDFIDIINPLQHLPVISHYYREYTGDTIAPEAQIFGGGLMGGPLGLVASAANVIAEEITGNDIFGNVMAFFDDMGAPAETQTAAVATAEPMALMAANLPASPNWAKQELAQNERLEPLDFRGVDGKAAPEPYLPSELPEDRAVLSLFSPELTEAREKHNTLQGMLFAQEVASDLDS